MPSNLYPTLRITQWTSNTNGFDIQGTDFTTFLRKDSPVYDKGRKISATYSDPVSGDLVAKKTFTDTVDGNGDLNGIDIFIEWFDDVDTALLSKTTHKPLNSTEAQMYLQARRRRAIEQLIAGAKGTTVETDVREIFIHYEVELKRWYELGGTALGDLIDAETDPTILGYLNEIPDPTNFPGQTTRDRIYYQIDYTPPA